MNEQEIIELEEKFPSLSGVAFSAAYERAIENGQSVLVARDGVIYEEYPDGKRIARKTINPPFHLPVGTKIKIR